MAGFVEEFRPVKCRVKKHTQRAIMETVANKYDSLIKRKLVN
jgi:hypothetical protein